MPTDSSGLCGWIFFPPGAKEDLILFGSGMWFFLNQVHFWRPVYMYLRVCFMRGIPSRCKGSNGKAVWVFSVSDFGLFHQVVQFFLGHVLHLLPVGWCLKGRRSEQFWRIKIIHDTKCENNFKYSLITFHFCHDKLQQCVLLVGMFFLKSEISYM